MNDIALLRCAKDGDRAQAGLEFPYPNPYEYACIVASPRHGFAPFGEEGMARRGQVRIKARISRINRLGLCEAVTFEQTGRAAFTLDKVVGYGGQPLREFGIEEGAEVELVEDETGRVDRVHLVDAATAA